jgi:TusA-related sulfurtransferase
MSDPVVLDVSNLLCPMPVIRAGKMAENLADGALLEIIATDLGVEVDIPAWARINGHQVLEIVKAGRRIVVTVQIARHDGE